MLTQHDHLATERFRMVPMAPVGSSQGGRPELIVRIAICMPLSRRSVGPRSIKELV